jgi:hypothetical protein
MALPEKTMNLWARGLQHASDLLIRRGSVMGPLIPLLFLIPFFLGAAWLFRDHVLAASLFGLSAIGIVFEYCRQYANFARRDPDRLQSEEYRYEMKKIQMIAAKELPYPVPADTLALPPATSNPSHPLPNVTDSEAIQTDDDGERQ